MDRRIIIVGIAAAVGAAVYFAAMRPEPNGIKVQKGSESAEDAAEEYFEAFRETDAERFISVMPEGKLKRQRGLFDSDEELYDSYRSQFEDEREFFDAIYGSDCSISYEITDSRGAEESIEDEDFLSASALSVTANIGGRKNHDECEGTLTLIETENGWYVYDSDFEKVFW